MGIYDAWRKDGGPTLYPSLKSAVTADVLEVGFIFAFVIVAFSFFIILPGFRGKERIFVFLRFTISILIGGVIMGANFGQEWEIAEIYTKTPYRAGTGQEIKAHIGVKIGLRSVNITLKGDPVKQPLPLNETVNYNERLHWSNPWGQGRLFFGPFAGRFNQEYRANQYKGLPLPILWIAEYFTFDGEGIRWGRHYRAAGFYTHIMCWLAFPLWILTNILFFMIPRYGGYFLMLTGGSMVTANIIFSSIRNFIPLEIPFEDNVLRFHYGPSYFANLIVGVICIILGLVVVFMDLRFPDALATFLSVDVLKDYEEYYPDIPEESNGHTSLLGGATKPKPGYGSMGEDGRDSEGEAGNRESNLIYGNQPMFRKRGTQKFQKGARKVKKAPVPLPRLQDLENGAANNDAYADSDEEDYANVEMIREAAGVRFKKDSASPSQVNLHS